MKHFEIVVGSRFVSALWTGPVAYATLLCVGTALAAPSPQQNCDKARVTAWKTYVSCVDTVVAREAAGPGECIVPGIPSGCFDGSAAFARCRHTYFKNWTTFQARPSLVGRN